MISDGSQCSRTLHSLRAWVSLLAVCSQLPVLFPDCTLSISGSLEHPEAWEQTQSSAKPAHQPPRATCSLHLHIWEWLHSLPSKISLSTFSKRQWQLARASHLNYNSLSKKSIPPLNIPTIWPSLPILFHALPNICHSPWCKQEHFRDLRTPSIIPP